MEAARVAITCRQRFFPTCYGSSYISGELAHWLADENMDHVRGAPRHPQTQSKIERWH
jgi:transposase InsO family protein